MIDCCLTSSSKHFMYIQDDNKLNNIIKLYTRYNINNIIKLYTRYNINNIIKLYT